MTDELQLEVTPELAFSANGIDFYVFDVKFAVADFTGDDILESDGAVDTMSNLADALQEAGWQEQAHQVRVGVGKLAGLIEDGHDLTN